MNISEFLLNLERSGVRVWADEDKLRIQAPKGILTSALSADLTAHKAAILAFLRNDQNGSATSDRTLSLQTIGRLIGGFCERVPIGFKSPIIDPQVMAKQLKITFRPLPDSHQTETVLQFRDALEQKFRDYGVTIESWEQATKEFSYDISIPLTPWKKSIKTRVVRSDLNAVVDVERPSSYLGQFKSNLAEKLYQLYSQFVLKDRKLPPSKIAQFIGWAEDHAIQQLEDPTNTQVIILSELDSQLIDSELPYPQKIPLGISTLVRTFSEIVVGISDTQISILNMNLSDSLFDRQNLDNFVLKSLVPKVYVPIQPLPLSRFAIEHYDPHQSSYIPQLIQLGRDLAAIGLLPDGFKIGGVVQRQSHRDIVDWIANGRTGVSYGFVAYIEPPQYDGALAISESEWKQLSSISGFSSEEVRQNKRDRWYIKTKIGEEYAFKQIPDIWLIGSRSGSNKSSLNLEQDVLRIGLSKKLILQLPQGIESAMADVKPSYDTYVMVAIALAAALYTPELIENGAPMIHFHGYPAIEWFGTHEYCAGMNNPSVPCGTYESGVFNFLGMHSLATKEDRDIALVGLIEPDHGTNIIARNLPYLLEKLYTGTQQGQIDLGRKHFASLTSLKV